MRAPSHLLAISTLLTSPALSAAITPGTLSLVPSFPSIPTAAKMYIYLPTSFPPSPPKLLPILVAIHHCNGNATSYFRFMNNLYPSLADSLQYLIIYPSAPTTGGCWDVSSLASLTHNGGGDSQTIVNMIKYAIENFNGDPDRVFASGTSSGAMMANVLAGAYPDVFHAVSAYSGVPDGCFHVDTALPGTNNPGWNRTCAEGLVVKTGQEWGDMVRGYFPEWKGGYPRVMIWHGTEDDVLRYPNYAEALKQWSNVHGVEFVGNVTDDPERGYTKSAYGDGTKVVGYSAKGVGHNVPIHELVELEFYDLV
ncbi:Alpha/Beta hydrolase protein [Podospora australis]|uniref:Alpha/Beta hydrolase protein n=1 Tax=Podospora australis TaxID=1536484 RepID=A0AAN6WHF2_9PEZI|nr:Alpha/Beta hydrolase protein [Podospora australis]